MMQTRSASISFLICRIGGEFLFNPKLKRSFLIFILIFISGFTHSKTKIVCFDITGKITDTNNNPITNTQIIFNPGRWNTDTILSDNNGIYKYSECTWPPCNKKIRKNWRKSEMKIVVSCAGRMTTILYIPKKWMETGKIKNSPVTKTMKKDLIF